MKESRKFTKILYTLGLSSLIFGLVYFNFGFSFNVVQAQVNYQPGSDYNGLAVTVSSLPWYAARAAGITSYILMFLVVIIGTGLTTSYTYKLINPTKAWIVHKYLSLALGITLIVHVVSLLFDKFINLTIVEILIPFYSAYNTIFLSLGILALYLLIIIIFSSLFFRLKSPRVWRLLHYLVYLFFILSFFHGVFMGSDTKTLTMKYIYWITGSSFFLLLVYRFWLNKRIVKNNSNIG
ncbi:MAG: ferric reductase-like transmembrane domain-containing protein [Patescibacteria group bacterium]|jgi:predicted ferric reductase